MKLFIWENAFPEFDKADGYVGGGLAIAYAETLEEAYKHMHERCGFPHWVCQDLKLMEPTMIIDCDRDRGAYAHFVIEGDR